MWSHPRSQRGFVEQLQKPGSWAEPRGSREQQEQSCSVSPPQAFLGTRGEKKESLLADARVGFPT